VQVPFFSATTDASLEDERASQKRTYFTCISWLMKQVQVKCINNRYAYLLISFL